MEQSSGSSTLTDTGAFSAHLAIIPPSLWPSTGSLVLSGLYYVQDLSDGLL